LVDSEAVRGRLVDGVLMGEFPLPIREVLADLGLSI